ncbi:Protein of unknown function [Andreprevotia lacus DSM 23236]|uniref:DUF1653 domain-containing protein n=1 Tax=Andreprevotia lacus DSM 23236 TaxID=1121001 RepID=A0A1W1X6I1_9NEIS|nr:DUF1653 domain-containing protein [Andreprevotia lacus]SMC19542.1 Protein of unknown function [Andreprevotia lacus DSM 23236]
MDPNASYFRHVDGGYYRWIADARHSEDLSPVVVYEHLWPFERGIWVRPAGEWAGRFSPVGVDEVVAALRGDRAQAQAAVTTAKALRRAARGT